MADKIRGLTVEISADASQFNKQMSAVRKEAKSSQAELNALQKSLEMEYDPSKFARAQKVAQDAIDATAKQAEVLRERLKFLEENGDADTSHYRQIQSELAQTELKAQQLGAQLEKLNNLKFEQLGDKIQGVGDKITGVGQALTPVSVAAAGTITGLGALGTNAVGAADNIATLAGQYDMTAEALQRFDYIALQTDTDSEVLYKSFVKMRAGIADIATGATSVASTALQKLNLDLNSFDGSEEQFYAIITALADMEDKTQMVAIANDVFGEKLANNLLPLINSGSDAIGAYAAEFDNLGALSDEQVNKLAEFDNVLNTIKTQLANVALQIGSSLLPIMQSLAGFVSESLVPKLQTLAGWFNSLTLGQQEFALKALAVVAALAPLTMGIGKLVSTVGSIIKMLPALKAGLSALASHPIILIIAAIAAILLVLYTQCESFRESINNLVSMLGGALQPVLDVVMGLLSRIVELLTPILNILGGILGTVINLVVEALSPFFDMLALIMELIGPLLEVALIPLQLQLTALSIPLQILGTLLQWLAPLFTLFANIVKGAFNIVLKVINVVLGAVETAINWCIDKINSLIDGINAMGGWLGISIDHLQKVSLQLDTSTLDGVGDASASMDTTPPDTSGVGALSPDTTYDKIGAGGTTGDIYNYDNSTKNTTQNVTVVIENYAADVDVDNLVRQINIKLAEAM